MFHSSTRRRDHGGPSQTERNPACYQSRSYGERRVVQHRPSPLLGSVLHAGLDEEGVVVVDTVQSAGRACFLGQHDLVHRGGRSDAIGVRKRHPSSIHTLLYIWTLGILVRYVNRVVANPIARMAPPTRTPRAKWIHAGLQALAGGGPDAVRVEPLAGSVL